MAILYQRREQTLTKNRDESQAHQDPLEHNDPLDEECLSDILYRSMCMLRTGETIANLSKSSSFNFRDMGFMDKS